MAVALAAGMTLTSCKLFYVSVFPPAPLLITAGAAGTSSTSATPFFWQYGTLNVLPVGTGNTFGESRRATEDGSGNLYFTGYVGTSNTTVVPCYWKNGTKSTQPLGSGNVYGYARGDIIGF
jgi:hypothetical protein